MSGCCKPKGLRKIRVGNSMAGVTGLDELVEEACRQGWSSEQRGLGAFLIAGLRAAGNYIAASEEAAYAEALVTLYREHHRAAQVAGAAAQGGITMKIEILGPGCARCRATEDNVRKAVAELGLEAEVVHISDLLEISRRRVMLTPGLIMEGQLKSSGRVPEVAEIKEWLQTTPARA